MTPIPNRTLDHLRRIADEPDLAGTRYELERELGRGGMGVVYQVRDRELDRLVALKVIDSGAEILPEARTIARLEHPGIVPLYDAGRLPDGRPWYTMRLVQGDRLDDFLARGHALPERLRVFQKICDALAFAHSRQVIHRDIKPRNIMVGTFGEVLVMDWGVAIPAGAQNSAAGTARCMAPEQATGFCDHRADIFSLGVLLKEIARQDRSRPLAAIAAKSMALNPADRYPNVESLSADVTRFMDGFPVAPYRENLIERAARFGARNRTLLLLVLTYAAVRFLLFFLRSR